MAAVTSPSNTNSERLDGVVLSSGPTALLKRAVAGSSRTVTGGDVNAAAEEVGTHADDAAFGVAVDTVMVIGGFADETSPDSVAEGDAGALRMTLARNLHTVAVADAAAVTSVASQDTNIQLLAANANRIGATIFNTDSGPLFVKFGATATATTSFTVRIPENGYFEFPHPVYRGQVDGIWTSSSTGAAVITELS